MVEQKLEFTCTECPEYDQETWNCKLMGDKASPTWPMCKEGIRVRVGIGADRLSKVYNGDSRNKAHAIETGMDRLHVMDKKYKEAITLQQRIKENAE